MQRFKELKNRKLPSDVNKPNKLLKYGGLELAKQLKSFFNQIFCTSTYTDDWHRSITISIFK